MCVLSTRIALYAYHTCRGCHRGTARRGQEKGEICHWCLFNNLPSCDVEDSKKPKNDRVEPAVLQPRPHRSDAEAHALKGLREFLRTHSGCSDAKVTDAKLFMINLINNARGTMETLKLTKQVNRDTANSLAKMIVGLAKDPDLNALALRPLETGIASALFEQQPVAPAAEPVESACGLCSFVVKQAIARSDLEGHYMPSLGCGSVCFLPSRVHCV